jgi:4-azaleucine resistance transporter AzlC
MSSIYRTLGRAALEGAVLKGALLKGPVLKGLLLRGADLKCAVRKGVVLKAAVLRDIALACLAVLFIGLSYGAIAVASGLPLWVPAVLSVLVLAGASEFLFIGIVAAGGNPLAAALAGLLVNARHLPYGLALPDGVTGRGWRRMAGTHLMNDESVVFSLAQEDLPRRRAAYWICGLGVLAGWPGGAVLGALIGSAVHDTSALGLDAMFPAVILALIVPALRDRVLLRAAAAGAAIALATTPFLPAGLPVLLAVAGVLLLVREGATDATAAKTDETNETDATPVQPGESSVQAGETSVSAR